MRRIRPLAAAAAAAVLAFACAAEARVFMRWRAGAESARALEAMGGRRIYEAEVQINGGAGRVAVFSFAGAVGEVTADLRRTFGKDLPGDGRGAVVTLREGGQVVRLLVTPEPESGRALVFHVVQTDAERRRSALGPAAASPAPGVPGFPGATIRSAMKNEDTGASVTVSEASAEPAAVRQFYSEAMRAAGWRPALPDPAGPAGAGGGMTVFLRGPEMCFVHVSAGPSPGTCLITLLHKTQGLQ